jgi:hypothetical protein
MVVSQRNKLYRKFHAMLDELGLRESKHDLLLGYGVDSTRFLSDSELIELVERVQNMKLQKLSADNRLRELRSQVLTILNQMSIYATNNDWSQINTFLLDNRVAGKLLYELTIYELEKLMPKLRSIAAKFKEKQETEKHLMIMN